MFGRWGCGKKLEHLRKFHMTTRRTYTLHSDSTRGQYWTQVIGAVRQYLLCHYIGHFTINQSVTQDFGSWDPSQYPFTIPSSFKMLLKSNSLMNGKESGRQDGNPPEGSLVGGITEGSSVSGTSNLPEASSISWSWRHWMRGVRAGLGGWTGLLPLAPSRSTAGGAPGAHR